MAYLLSKFANDHNEMNDFSRKLAIKILKNEIDIDKLSQPEKLLKRCSKWLNHAQ